MEKLIWSDDARARLRSIDQETALRLLRGLSRFLKTNAGDVKQLQGFNPPRYRLRFGDWRLIFSKRGVDVIEIIQVSNRKDAYR
jgi:mRNA-degrading endonuclease RelE of RelBE toxin-antitoxin system